MSFVILDTDGIDVIVQYREINAVERTKIGVILEVVASIKGYRT